MTIDHNENSLRNDPPSRPRSITPLRTNRQAKAAAMASEFACKAKWKTLVAEADAQWVEIGSDDLIKVEGNFHKLAGLVQLRCRLSREESDRQVKAFFEKHALGA
jgi:hypothetical protein